ncbi:MAG TPA: DEAD/DEAH box helicase family protein, partial [Tissierellaceae bacterium]
MDKVVKTSKLNSYAEEIFLEIFIETFGIDKSKYLYVEYPFVDIYGGNRAIDFALELEDEKIAIEIDGSTYHDPKKISDNKYHDDLLRQNSLIYNGWKVYRWTYNQLIQNKEKSKDELVTFLGQLPEFKTMSEYLPKQEGSLIELSDSIEEYSYEKLNNNEFELYNHQKEALKSLEDIRSEGKTIALLIHATGTGKTITAVSDAKKCGGRTLFLGHRKEIIEQAKNTFDRLWPEKNTGYYFSNKKNKDNYITCASIQSVYNNLEYFDEEQFEYIIIDEAHHSTAETYRKILGKFKPKFILGLTATPYRTDGENILEIFESVAHRLDIKTAVEIGKLVPIRCIRIKTDVDISDVRINGIKYNSRDLESKLFVPERNNIIVKTYLEYVNNKKTVIFLPSVENAIELSTMFKNQGIEAEAVSGSMDKNKRKQVLKDYEKGNINVLCACDLLNEGWDSPKTEVLFMARPTMSKTIYMQQLGRGMRTSPGKKFLLVFDFVDNTGLFNTPYSIHRIFDIEEYRPGQLVVGSKTKKKLEKDLIYKGEKPAEILDIPVNILDYEIIDLFDWQKEVEGMVSVIELIQMVDVQEATVIKKIKDGELEIDLEVPAGKRTFKYIKKDKIKGYADKFGWELITPANIKEKFMEYIEKMDMSYSYKPVFLKAYIDNMVENKAKVEDIVDTVVEFYEDRKNQGLIVEKKRSIY